MSLVSRVRNVLTGWRETDPYHYECTVCERSFGSERSTCPDCGGEVERAMESVGMDPGP